MEFATSLEALGRESLAACDGVLVRIWTIGPGDSCAACPMRPECPDQVACLHLAVSIGVTSRLDGRFRRFPIGARRVGRVVVDGRPLIERGDLASCGLADPAWLSVHGVRSFAAVPLSPHRVGVLAVFSRRLLTDAEVNLLALAARAAVPAAGASRPLAAASQPVAGASQPLAGASQPVAGAERRTLAEIERDAIERVLVETRGRISGPRGAANILGLKPSTLASRMQKLGVRRPRRAPP